jgi:uncharacterized damage-inducible protein DinB
MPGLETREILSRMLRGTRRRSRRIWQAIPEEKSRWRPEGAVLTVAEVVQHVAEADQFWMNAIRGDLYRDVAESVAPAVSLAREIEIAEARRAELLDWISALPPEEFERVVEIAKYHVRQQVAFILSRLADHEAHHRGQLIVYLRLGGLSVPFIWD